jgi:glycosyltransferase involved in cell wall biosynthesis
VGSAPYADDYTRRVHALADERVRFLGGVWDQELLDQLYANCATYLHGHSVGGTNPSLLRAIGAGAAVTAFDVDFNREVVRDSGRFFRTPQDVARAVAAVEADPEGTRRAGRRARELAARYDWDEVADGYEALARRLAAREVPGRRPSGRRRPTAADLPLAPLPPAPRPAATPVVPDDVVPLSVPTAAAQPSPAARQ